MPNAANQRGKPKINAKRAWPKIQFDHPIKAGIFMSILFFVLWLSAGLPRHNPDQVWGVNFSPYQAEYLGLNWKAAFTALLDDMKVRHFRIGSYWNHIEPEPYKLDFSDVNYQIEEAAKRDAKIILVVGMKTPRWPECHLPDWAKKLTDEEVRERVLGLVAAEVVNAAKYKNIVAWQVENEPFLRIFGFCPYLGEEVVAKEIDMVRQLDPLQRPVVVTEAGELSTWVRAGKLADVLGISLYRVVQNDYIGYAWYPWGPSFYYRHADLLKPLIQKVIVTELQVEPWMAKDFYQYSRVELNELFNLKMFEDSISVARGTGFGQVYLWGVEYFYWLKQHNDPVLWDRAKQLFERGY